MSARFPLRLITGIEHHGYALGSRQVFWTPDDPQPWMIVPTETDGELLLRVRNPAFNVEPGRSQRRNPQMKRAALAFFAPLLEDRP